MNYRMFLISVVVLFWSVFPAKSTADGCFVWTNEKIDILEPEQKVLIFFHEGCEDLVLSVKFEGALEEFGWIVPLPSVPDMSAEDVVLFEYLSKATQERQALRSERGRRYHGTLAGSDAVEVIKKQTVGIYDAVILKAGDSFTLKKWLITNNFNPPVGADEVFGRYIRKGWVFAAMNIRPGELDSLRTAELTSGTIQPVRFRFECEEPVFPLEISSLNPGGSHILVYLLCSELLVPRSVNSTTWQSQVYSRAGNNHWIYQYQYESKGKGTFLPDYQGPFYLTKHRAHLDPGDMKDVYFGPYDPAPGVESSDSTVRIETVTHLGLKKPPEAEKLILQNLANSPRGRELCATLWALGEVGGGNAESALMEYLGDSDLEARLEAVEALAAMNSFRALPHFIEAVGKRNTACYDSTDNRIVVKYPRLAQEQVRQACFDYLIKAQDNTCISGLGDLAEKHRGMKRWEELGKMRDKRARVDLLDEGTMAIAALAACGDDRARHQIIKAIITGGKVTTHENLQLAAERNSPISYESVSSINSHPGGFWTGRAAVSTYDVGRPWRAFYAVHELFSANTAFRDKLYRECAQAEQIPDAGVIVLLANIETLNQDDVDHLMEIWGKSIRYPVATIEVVDVDTYHAFSRFEAKPDTLPTIRYNYNASAIAFALGRHKCCAELAYLWDTAPRNDEVLLGDIAFAMAVTRDPRFYDAVGDYVRHVWGRKAGSPEFAGKLYERMESYNTGDRWRLAFYYSPFDMSYRTGAICRYLFEDVNSTRELITDRGLPTYLRFFIFVQPNYFTKEFEPMFAEANRELEILVAGLVEDEPLLTWLVDNTVEIFGRISESLKEREIAIDR